MKWSEYSWKKEETRRAILRVCQNLRGLISVRNISSHGDQKPQLLVTRDILVRFRALAWRIMLGCNQSRIRVCVIWYMLGYMWSTIMCISLAKWGHFPSCKGLCEEWCYRFQVRSALRLILWWLKLERGAAFLLKLLNSVLLTDRALAESPIKSRWKAQNAFSPGFTLHVLSWIFLGPNMSAGQLNLILSYVLWEAFPEIYL